MFKVLVIAYYFPPLGLSGVQRTLKFTKYMKDFNWEPHVLTTSQTGYFAHDDSLLKEANDANIKITRIGGKEINSLFAKRGNVDMPREIIRKTLSRVSNTIFIPDNKKSWSRKAFFEAKKIYAEDKFDLIFVSAPPFSSINTAVKLKKELGVPIVIDYRDLWYGNQFHFYPTPYHSYQHKRMEYKALKAADRIIVTNRRMKENILNQYKFLTFEDIFIIPHGFDPEDFALPEEPKKSAEKFIITYSGIFYEHITPKYFLKAFKEIAEQKPEIAENIELRFIGLFRKENQKLVKKLKLQKYVKEFGYLNHKSAVANLMESDLLWLMVGKGRNSDTISSGKLYEYFGSKKPILASLPEGALKNAAEEYGASFITSPDNIDEIKNAILQSYEQFKNGSLPVPSENFVEKHRRDFLTDQLTKQFQFLVKEEL